MFVEIADGLFIAVDTIAQIERYLYGGTIGGKSKLYGFRITTKRGVLLTVRDDTPYYNNVQELVNART